MTTKLYDTDFYKWTVSQADLLRNEDYAELDLENLIEEIESMGKRDKRELASRLTVLLMHLLKLHYQPERRGNSWLRTTRTQRQKIDLVLKDSPSLRREIPALIEYVYPQARKNATTETELLLATFPIDCPWTAEQILDGDWLPG